ncbi:trans-sialidase, putative, partial [Trypanosoma cruzi marinkellei]
RVYASAVLLFLVMMMCCGSGAADAEVKPATSGQFKWEGINNEGDVTVKSVGASGLVKVGDDVFAVAEAQCMKEGDGASTFTGIASQLLTKETTTEPEGVLKPPKGNTQVLEKEEASQGKKKVDVSRPTTVVKGSEIYMLVGKYSPTTTVDGQEKSVAVDSGLLLVKGDVSGDGQSDKGILWKDTQDVPRASFGAEHQSLEGLI